MLDIEIGIGCEECISAPKSFQIIDIQKLHWTCTDNCGRQKVTVCCISLSFVYFALFIAFIVVSRNKFYVVLKESEIFLHT